MRMTDSDVVGLRALAEKAQPSDDWFAADQIVGAFGNAHLIPDAEFIEAFSPDVVLALLDEITTLRAENERLKQLRDRWQETVEKVVKSGVTLEQILAGVENYRREIGPTPDWSKVKYPQGWLNAARWEDEPAPAPTNEPVALRSPEAPEDCGRHKWAVDGTCLFCNTRRVVA